MDPILTVKMWFTWNFCIIWLISIYSGVTQGFQFGDFPSYIDKNSYKFYALSCFGAFDAIFSSIFGCVSDKVGRLPILFCAISAHASVYIFMYFVGVDNIAQDSNGLPIWLTLGGLLGIGDAGFNTQILSLYPILLGDRPESFANFNLWQSASSCFCFFWSLFISTKIKIATYFGVLILSAVPIFLTPTGRNAARSKKFAKSGH